MIILLGTAKKAQLEGNSNVHACIERKGKRCQENCTFFRFSPKLLKNPCKIDLGHNMLNCNLMFCFSIHSHE